MYIVVFMGKFADLFGCLSRISKSLINLEVFIVPNNRSSLQFLLDFHGLGVFLVLVP